MTALVRRRDRIGELRDVHAEVVGAVDEHGPRAHVCDGADGGDERVRGGDELVVGPDPDRLQAKPQRVRSRVDAYGMATADQRSEARLEFASYRFAQGVIAGGDDLFEPREDRLRIRGLLWQIGERIRTLEMQAQQAATRIKFRRCSRGTLSRCLPSGIELLLELWRRWERRCAAMRRAADGCADA